MPTRRPAVIREIAHAPTTLSRERSVNVPLVVMAAGLSRRFGRLKQLHPSAPVARPSRLQRIRRGIRAGFSRILYVVRPEILDACGRT
jgi:CTP:molybdopterin cytidylyltransferase MocA